METLTITAHTVDTNQINVIKAFMKSMKIKFEISKIETQYNHEFVEKIKQNREDYKNGKFKKITLDEIWK